MSRKMYKLAFPSWVVPGAIAENARFVCSRWEELLGVPEIASKAGVRPEIGLCFFEAAACLVYDQADLPRQLAHMPCSWHVHLPVDLPMHTHAQPSYTQVKECFSICEKLMEKCEFLGASLAVLHPPLGLQPGRGGGIDNIAILERFVELWVKRGFPAAGLLLENQPGSDPGTLLSAANACGTGLCFDFAHLFMQPLPNGGNGSICEKVLDLAASAQIWHLNAVGENQGGHAPLTCFSPLEKGFFSKICKMAGQLDRPPRLMLELFSWGGIEASLPVLLHSLP